MGYTTATIRVTNKWTEKTGRQELVDDYEIKSMNVPMLVDTGSYYLCINESVMECLGLSIHATEKLQLANGVWENYCVTGPVELAFENRRCITNAVVLPGNSECLQGVIPMEAMDVIVHPQKKCLRQTLIIPILRCTGYEWL